MLRFRPTSLPEPLQPRARWRRRAQTTTDALHSVGVEGRDFEQDRFTVERSATPNALEGLARLNSALSPELAVLVQRYVQEELGPGLHIEPWRQAIDAYLARDRGGFSGCAPWIWS